MLLLQKNNILLKIFLKLAFAEIGINDWKNYIRIDNSFKRPVDVTSLCGNYDKAKKI